MGRHPESSVSAVDLFCGAGGLTYGLRRAGVRVEAGIDIDGAAQYAYTANNPGARFLQWDLSRKRASTIEELFGAGYRLLAGCAPCQPFSKLTNGKGKHQAWNLLDRFANLVARIEPDLVTMENVPELARRGSEVFERFLHGLRVAGYQLDWRIVNCSEFGVPQSRKRLVLLASRLGPIAVPQGRFSSPSRAKTVRGTIGDLAPVRAGEAHATDPLHAAALLSEMNMRRIRATAHDGGTRESWPQRLLLDCQRKASGARYRSIYGRMWWDRPAPTMTTLCNGIGNGRFGHPEQDRAITLREAALLQSFPRNYQFWPPKQKLNASAAARLIGNAVPPALGLALGRAILLHVNAFLPAEAAADR